MYARYVPPSKGSQTPQKPAAPSPAPVANTPTDGYSYSRYIPGAKPAPKPVEQPQVQYFDDEPSPPNPKRKREVAEESSTPDTKKSKKAKSRDDAPKQDEVVVEAESDEKEEEAPIEEERSEKKDRVTEESLEGQSEPHDGESKKSKKEKKKKKKSKTEAADEEDGDVSMVDAEGADNPDTADSTTLEKTEKEQRKREKKKTKQKAAEVDSDDETEAKRHKAVLDRKTKSLQLARELPQDASDEDEEEAAELHGLEPLPQPAPAAASLAKPTYETLPHWLAAPIRVSQDTRKPFTDLGVLPKAARVLQERGFQDAFAVQTAAIPLLLPTSSQRPGDVLISAATGSGKTLAYALPVVRDISQGPVTRLRALVVLPTRELVKQAQEAFELCARAYEGGNRKRVRVGVSIGSQSLKSEQETLMDRETRYDPETYREISLGTAGGGGDDDGTEEADPRLSHLDGHVVDFTSKVDVLICTPGRLVEHMEQTPGFSLDYVRWLVVDEADKLLAQSFQGWLDLVMEKFKVDRFSARDFPDVNLTGVRKIILSATLTRDLSLLNQLALQRPQLIVLESDEGAVAIAEHSLPPLLKEFAVRVHDINLKPLYLLELLRGQHMLVNVAAPEEQPKEASSSDSDDTSSDDGSDTSSDSSDTSSDSDSDSDSPSPVRSPKSTIPVSLIFTKSNESALRLSRLLTLLDSSLEPHISTLTSTTPSHIRRKTLRAFTTPSSPIRLIIASDLVARGIDIPTLDHVINYDLPPSVAGYVHRVGRTARAGRAGSAWTLVGDDESGWFWGKIAKGAGVRRAQKVDRTRIEEMSEDRVEEYEAALEKLGKEAGR